MAHPNKPFEPHSSGDFLSEEFDTEQIGLDLSPFVRLQQRDVRPLYEWNERGRTHNGRAAIVGTVACYIARVGGNSYYVQNAQPVTGIESTGRTINKTPPFITQDDSGVNEVYTSLAVESGFEVTTVSQEAGWQRCPRLAETALNYVAIADKLRREAELIDPDTPIDPTEDEEGGSRGSIFAVEKTRLKHVLGRETGNLEVLAPVYHHNNSLLQDGLLYARAPLKEARGLLRILLRHPQHVGVLAGTIIRNPWEFVHAAKSIQSLRGAQTQTAIRQMPRHQSGTATIAGKDSFGQTKELLNEYSAFPNIAVRHVVDGYHVSFTDPVELRAYKERTMERGEILRQTREV